MFTRLRARSSRNPQAPRPDRGCVKEKLVTLGIQRVRPRSTSSRHRHPGGGTDGGNAHLVARSFLGSCSSHSQQMIRERSRSTRRSQTFRKSLTCFLVPPPLPRLLGSSHSGVTSRPPPGAPARLVTR